jgi:hypothetical protein
LPDPYVIQQLALHTYKAKDGPQLAALLAAWEIIEQLSPATSTDPETLGIAGAIQKRLHAATQMPAHLELAIELYGRGFEVKRDYYNGENYATCLDMRAALQSNAADADYDRKTARKVRERIVTILDSAMDDPHTKEGSDYKWMLATMANTLRALGRNGDAYEQEFRALRPADWEIDTFEQGRKYALGLSGATSGG